jgi:hypothetical protein
MNSFRKGSPELFFVISALLGILLSAVVSLVPALGFSFVQFLTIMLSADVVTYIAMKAGVVKTPGGGG